ncbi:MAG: hypothetical protein HQL69_13755 [Magnetococcales bacterium]|nr:hypothetical protein [Magnetococcales bacterium]
MNISSAAGFLINRAVRMAADLNQGGQGGANRSTSRSAPSKILENAADPAKITRRNSSAYRVSLSSSALQKGAMESISA